MTIRVGFGFDSHRFVSGRPLILGGQRIPHDQGLEGYSDADAVGHALIDAILGAAGLGNIGQHFPETDPRWKNADSIQLLRTAYGTARGAGFALRQADMTVIAERPRLGPYLAPMAAGLAEAIGVDPSCINIKPKTNEGMGFIGRGEGVAVFAVVTLEGG